MGADGYRWGAIDAADPLQTTMEANCEKPRVYASSGTSPGRGGAFGAAATIVHASLRGVFDEAINRYRLLRPRSLWLICDCRVARRLAPRNDGGGSRQTESDRQLFVDAKALRALTFTQGLSAFIGAIRGLFLVWLRICRAMSFTSFMSLVLVVGGFS